MAYLFHVHTTHTTIIWVNQPLSGDISSSELQDLIGTHSYFRHAPSDSNCWHVQIWDNALLFAWNDVTPSPFHRQLNINFVNLEADSIMQRNAVAG